MVEACRVPRSVSVVVAVLLLCLVGCLTFLSLPARGTQDPSALAGMANVVPVDPVAHKDAPPLDGSYFSFALADESDEDPVNAGFLTMLVLAASFLGASALGWLLTKAQGQGALCFSSLGAGELFGSTREDYLPFLGVFRL